MPLRWRRLWTALLPILPGYLGGVLQHIDCTPIRVGGVCDHVHLFFGVNHTISVTKVVEKLKTSSAKWSKEKAPGLTAFHGQHGCGIFSVSQSDAVEHYVRDQEAHHPRMTFQDDCRTLLQRYPIAFDERQVWD